MFNERRSNELVGADGSMFGEVQSGPYAGRYVLKRAVPGNPANAVAEYLGYAVAKRVGVLVPEHRILRSDLSGGLVFGSVFQDKTKFEGFGASVSFSAERAEDLGRILGADLATRNDDRHRNNYLLGKSQPPRAMAIDFGRGVPFASALQEPLVPLSHTCNTMSTAREFVRSGFLSLDAAVDVLFRLREEAPPEALIAELEALPDEFFGDGLRDLTYCWLREHFEESLESAFRSVDSLRRA